MSVQFSDLLLLDTNVLINVVRGNEIANRIDQTPSIRQRADRPLISVISVGEALSFATQLKWGTEKVERLRALMDELVVMDINSALVLESYARFDALQISGGWNLKENDLWIAACSAASGAVLVTSDRDFDQLQAGEHLRRFWIDPNTRG